MLFPYHRPAILSLTSHTHMCSCVRMACVRQLPPTFAHFLALTRALLPIPFAHSVCPKSVDPSSWSSSRCLALLTFDTYASTCTCLFSPSRLSLHRTRSAASQKMPTKLYDSDRTVISYIAKPSAPRCCGMLLPGPLGRKFDAERSYIYIRQFT